MIMPKDKSFRMLRNVSTEAIRLAVLDECGYVKELPASEWHKFPWDNL